MRTDLVGAVWSVTDVHVLTVISARLDARANSVSQVMVYEKVLAVLCSVY